MINWIDTVFEALGLSLYGSTPLVLFLSGFLSATLLPGGSEAALVAALKFSQYPTLYLVSIATLGNTLGGFVNYWMGLWLPNRTHFNSGSQRSIEWLHKYGYWTLLFSWFPVIGDVLCLAAGWLRMKWMPSFICIFIGKAIRYSILTAIFLGIF
jgi:membrane protein YqaA with SNARE-associated domain